LKSLNPKRLPYERSEISLTRCRLMKDENPAITSAAYIVGQAEIEIFPKGGETMNIVGVTACTAGIAHTYIAKEKLVKAALELGYTVKIETQGTIGTEDELTRQDVEKADIVIIAADIKVGGKERFTGKKVIEVPMQTVIKSPKALLQKIEEKLKG
jgi:fructose PTS system EIIB component